MDGRSKGIALSYKLQVLSFWASPVGYVFISMIRVVWQARQASVTPTFDVGVKFISRDGFIIEIRYQKSDF